MVRSKEKPRTKGYHTSDAMLKAITLHRQGMSIRKAASVCNLAYPTVRRYISNTKDTDTTHLSSTRLTPHYDVNKIFTEEQEEALKSYVKECALTFYGLSTKDCRRVAYQMAKMNGIKVHESWDREKMAGFEWLRSFRKRHADVSLKKPEACSLARATSFNKENIKTFFDNLKRAMDRHPSFGNGCRIYNLDETATTTVQRPQKVLAPKGVRNLGKVTSGEKGTLVTTCAIVNATGQALPPVLIFPRKNYKDYMLTGAPPGSLGLANPTGWMTAELFVEVINHFIKHTSASPENPALLIIDNHESHLSIETLDLAKKSGIVVLTLPPHTTAKLQPLDVGLNGPFKVYYNSAIESWLLRNPGKPMTIYSVAECVGIAYQKAMTPVNISQAFRKCGIFPFDPNIFTEIDFLPSTVTDRPEVLDEHVVHLPNANLYIREVEEHEVSIPNGLEVLREAEPSTTGTVSGGLKEHKEPESSPYSTVTSNSNPQPGSSGIVKSFLSPNDFLPPLKAGPRNNKRKQRKLRKSIIATDTPEKDQITQDKLKTLDRKSKAKKIKRSILTDTKTTLWGKKTQEIESDSESEEEMNITLTQESGSSDLDEEIDDDNNGWPILTENFEPLSRKPSENDYVLVLLQTKKLALYYVAQILEVINTEEYFVSYLKLKDSENMRFSMPLEPDFASVGAEDIKFILPSPQIHGTKR